jgi:monomeric sarcosine oxidase
VRHERIVVVGAGIVGLSTAYALLAQGMRHVTVLEQEVVDHQRATSHSFSRLLRFEYGPDSLYSRMVLLSLARWKRLEWITKRTLYTPTGLLGLGTEDDNFTEPGYHLLRELGLPIERLSQEQSRQRFPQFATHPYGVLTYNAEAGVLHASTCLRTLRDLILDLGGEIHESCRVTRLVNDNQAHPVYLHLSSGEQLVADRVVLATGPWVHRLLAYLRLPVRVTRQYLLYFAGLPSSSFEAGVFPAFVSRELYGFPIHTGCNGWLKAASHKFGAPIDPDEISTPDQSAVAQVIWKIQELLPAVRQARLAHVDSCMYDVSPDEDFILDHVPYDPRIVFATGLTGHGFKFGLLLGEILSSMICGTEPVLPLDRFRLGRFAYEQVSVA